MLQSAKEGLSLRFITKRDGRKVPFCSAKITSAILKAAEAVGGSDEREATRLTYKVLSQIEKNYSGSPTITVEEVQDIVEKVLIEAGHAKTAKAYILYRHERNKIRQGKSTLMDLIGESLRETDRENANVGNSFSAKLLKVAEIGSREYYLSRVIPEDISNAHRQGDIHIHDVPHYGSTVNCIQVPLGKLLRNGFNNGHGYIRPPKRPASASALAAIGMQSSQNDMFGGQSYAFFDRDIAPYFENASEEEAFQAMEAFIYNLNTMHSRAGAQVPFSSLNVGGETSQAARKVTRNLLLAYEKGLGRGENPIFPNIIFRVKKGISLNEGDPNYDLFKLAIRVASRRLNPTFSFMDSSFNAPHNGEVGYMGCRTRVMANICGPTVTDGRGNLSFTTINLPRLALRATKTEGDFFAMLDNMASLVIRQLVHRYKLQCSLRVKDLPFVLGQGLYLDSDSLKDDDTAEQAFRHGTISIGFIGLAECLTALTGKHHGESTEANELGHRIISRLRQITDEASEIYKLNVTLIATPAEGLSGRFLKLDKEKYGVLAGITDKEYYTNSFHVPVHYSISAFDKITIEGSYHKYTNAGHISYVEFKSPPIHNLESVEAIIRHMVASDMGYAGINFPVDFCLTCGLTGVIDAECPECGQTSIRRIRRITGYLSELSRFNEAKASEAENRVSHF